MRGLRKGCIALVAAACAGLGVAAQAAEPSYDELRQEVRELRSRLDQVESRQSDAISSRDIDANIDRVLKDAEKRSQLLQMEGFTAGYNKGKFIIQDAAGNWMLHPFFQFQFRGVANYREDGKGEDRESLEKGFEVRRMKFGFDGNAFNPNLTYYFLWATSRSSGGVSLEQAYVKYAFSDQWAMRAGQIRNPLFHEQDTSSSRQLAADRSATNTIITGTGEAFTQSVSAMYGGSGPLQIEFGVGDGFETGNTSFLDGTTGNWGVFTRANYFVNGTSKEYQDFTARGNTTDLLAIGGGFDLTQYDDVDSLLYTIDVQWENTGGLGIYAAWLGNFLDDNEADDTFHNWGLIGQVGYMVNEQWEVFGRAGYSSLDDVVGEDTYCEITGGVNWYIAGGHAAKITLDVTVLPNGAPADDTGLGILATDDTSYIVRGQFQLLL